ncbi:MAG: T9SS type A sorting domain-containing protein [Bacteroidota bacterium]|nr:T9SS type A sorting domain-containing protein [Bacteroidota bacterium]
MDKNLWDSISDYLLGRSGCLIRFSDNQFYSIGYKRTFTSNWEHNRVMLTSYNQDFDTLWTQYFGESMKPFDTSYIFSQLKKTSDNNLILGGEWMPYGGAIRMCLIKTDTSGNMLWKKSYGSGSGYYRGFSVIETSDKGYALGGFLFYIGQDESGDPIVVKTDSLGNQQWMKNLGGSYTDHIAMLTNTSDGNIIAAYSYADTMLSPYDPVSRICITKMDNQGNIIWHKFYGAPEPLNYVNNIKELDDGSLVIVGVLPDVFPAYAGWLLKTNSNGDSIWYRKYKNIYGEESKNYLYDVIETSDNGLAACGYLHPVLPDTGDNDTWIIKLDSNGCDTPGCDPTVVIPIEVIDGDGLHVFPNPAGERFIVRYAFFMEEDCTITIFDLFGRKIKEIRVPKGDEKITINVENWQRGLYLVKVNSGNGYSESAKVILE